MSYVLLLFEKLPGLVVIFNDVWFPLQQMKGFERNAAESKLFALVRDCFQARAGEENSRTKWEIVKSEGEIIGELNTFFDKIK